MFVRPFLPSDQIPAQRLVLAGLEEHWGALDPTLNSDLNDIALSYADGLFLVGVDGERLVATGAYLPLDGRTCQIVRMSVSRELRGQGLGQQMLAELLSRARAAGYQRVMLETTETWQDAIRFYLKSGFQITHRQDGDVYFQKEIG